MYYYNKYRVDCQRKIAYCAFFVCDLYIDLTSVGVENNKKYRWQIAAEYGDCSKV